MGDSENTGYFEYLQSRSRLAWWYRKYYLYPRLGRYLSGRVLDVGCGIGDLLRCRPGTVGVDINSQTVAFCRGQGLDVSLMAPDLLPFDAAVFDSVVLDNVLEHLGDPDPLLGEIARVLTHCGRLLVGVPGRCGFAADPDHKIRYDEAGLVDCMTARGFGLRALLHAPLRSAFLEARMPQYCIYGVFDKVTDKNV